MAVLQVPAGTLYTDVINEMLRMFGSRLDCVDEIDLKTPCSMVFEYNSADGWIRAAENLGLTIGKSLAVIHNDSCYRLFEPEPLPSVTAAYRWAAEVAAACSRAVR